ncbi:IclR family transcriptional regulator [Streptomyces sp. MP131-18]|uniref:IclR family transcriptional regulator n=1 Tax=Streptomyces sp. MP131-18 TaxID=1857892 RepID=UPI00097C944B|nr:IclR family transcriptional regulator [Streptomyces sp. MP131-18]ONK14341.1 Acetate operon repressor [Streptomyces sp. MP131-18]
MATEVPAVVATVRILEKLAAEAPAAVPPGRLVTELELNRSTCYNILATLQRSGWVLNVGNRGGWTLGPTLLSMSGKADEVLSAISQHELQALSGELGFIAFLAERTGAGDYVVIAKAERQKGVRVTVDVGDNFPFSAPALMQAFCAWLPSAEFGHLAHRHGVVQFTDRTVVDPQELALLFESVRKDGFSRSIRQFNPAQGAVAAPVFDARGQVAKAVCVLAFSSELDETNVAHVGASVRACARRITQRTGGIENPAVGAAAG